MRRLRSAALTALLLALGPGCGGEGERPPTRARLLSAVPRTELPRTGIVADAPRDAIEIGIAADGAILVGGVEGGLPELRVALSALMQGSGLAARHDLSGRDVVLRASAAVPWPVVQWVMQVCARADLSRLHFAVMPEAGGPEGVIEAWLPTDSRPQAWGDADRAREVTAHVFAHEGTADRGAVYAWLEALLDEHRLTHLTISTHPPRTPRAGPVVELLDLGLRAGFRHVTFAGATTPGAYPPIRPDAPPGSLPWLRAWVATQRDLPSGWKVRAGVRTIDGASAAAPLPAPPPRRAAPAGVQPALVVQPQFKAPPLDLTPTEAFEPTLHGIPIDPTLPPRPFARRADRLRAPVPGDATSNAAVERGLAWLAAHQSPDGGFEAAGFAAWCDGKATDGKALEGRGTSPHDVGVTGLALLAFLGAGYTNRTEGAYGKLVGLGLKHLRNVQDEEGCIGPRSTERFVYDHAIGALALVEAYAMTGSVIYKQATQKALDFVALARNPSLAWRYGVKPGDDDTSVTAWMFLVLDAARRVNAFDVARGFPPSLTIDGAAFDGVKAWIDAMTDPATGSVGYDQRGSGSTRPIALADRFPASLVEGLTAVGVFTRLAAGETADGSVSLRRGIARIAALPPAWDEAGGSIDLYAWRMCAIAMANVGGETAAAWRGALLSALLPHQRADGDVCGTLGSWDPIDPWGPDGGRVYATSMALLALLAPYTWEPPAPPPR